MEMIETIVALGRKVDTASRYAADMSTAAG